jgi:hypothetical protein
MKLQPWNESDNVSGTYVGHAPFEKAYRFLLKTCPKASRLLNSKSVLVHRSNLWEEIEPLVEKERQLFREKFDIPETSFVFMVAPGNNRREIRWIVPRL